MIVSINLRPESATPLKVEEETYDQLIKNTAMGWSQSGSELEWLAKLHYLRAGFSAGKLDATQFAERETRLVLNWLHKLI